jgi:MscS family membrane protein
MFQNVPANLQEFLVRVLMVVVAFTFIWVMRGLLTWLLVRPLRRYSDRSATQWDNVVVTVFDAPIRYFIVTIGLFVAMRVLLPPNFIPVADHITRTLIIMIIFGAIYRAIGQVALSRSRLLRMTGLTVEERLVPFIRTALRLVLIALALVIIVQEWEYDVSGLVAGLGLGGLAFSLAAQDLLANIFGFSAIVGDSPFVVGEFIKTEDVEGTVEHVGLRSTQIRRPDQAYVSMPNSKLASSPVLNWSRISKRWINMTLLISYNTDRTKLQQMMQGMRDILAQREKVEKESIIVHFSNFASGGMEVLVRCYVMFPDWTSFSEERQMINLAFLDLLERLDIQLSSPTVSVQMPSMPLAAPEVPQNPSPDAPSTP